MTHICQTDIKFFGNEDALNDLFERLSNDWLSRMTERFGISFDRQFCHNVLAFGDGYITAINKNEYTIHLQDLNCPYIAFWDAVIDTNYRPGMKRLIDFVYTSTCPENNIFINSDIDCHYFDFRYGVAYDVLGKKDVITFRDKNDLFAWCREKCGIDSQSISEINDFVRIKIDEYIGADDCAVNKKHSYFRAVYYATSL